MRFKDWIQTEAMTSTNCVAGFSRIAIPLVFRQWPPAIAADLECGRKDKKKKKVKPQPQVKESFFFEGMMTPEAMPLTDSITVHNVGQDRFFYLSNGAKNIGKLKLRKINDDLWCPHNDVDQTLGKGYGPLLYDLAIEYATAFGKGVLPATGAASIYGIKCYNTDASNNVWSRYYNNRSDVQHRLHPKVAQQSKGFMGSVKSMLGLEEVQPLRDVKTAPWLYCIYTKEPSTMSKMQQMGKLTFATR